MENQKPRQLGLLLKDSISLAAACIKENAIFAAVVLLVAYFISLGFILLSGMRSKEDVEVALKAGDFLPLVWLGAAYLTDKLFDAFIFVGVCAALLARDGGAPIGPVEAARRSVDRLVAFIWTEGLVLFWVCVGLILLIVPGILWGIRYSLAHIVVIVEGRSGGAALARSKEIMLAHMAKVFGNLLVLALLMALIMGLGSFAIPSGIGPFGVYLYGLLKWVVAFWGLAFTVLLYKDLAAVQQSSPPVPAGSETAAGLV